MVKEDLSMCPREYTDGKGPSASAARVPAGREGLTEFWHTIAIYLARAIRRGAVGAELICQKKSKRVMTRHGFSVRME